MSRTPPAMSSTTTAASDRPVMRSSAQQRLAQPALGVGRAAHPQPGRAQGIATAMTTHRQPRRADPRSTLAPISPPK